MEFTLYGDNLYSDIKLEVEEDAGDRLLVSIINSDLDERSWYIRVSREDFLRLAQAIRWSEPASYNHDYTL